jgi:predicted transposase YbfD/YdcC
MKVKLPIKPLMEELLNLPDPRVERTKKHLLIDIIVLTVCAVICGADGWVDVERFGRTKRKFLRRFLRLPNGIPSHDTIGRVFSLLEPEALSACFAAWVKRVAELSGGEVVALDGKTLRRSFDGASGRGALHVVNAWATRNGLSLGQRRCAEGCNEIGAITEILELPDIGGCVVSVDAGGCQREIAGKIVGRGGDYLPALKGNQGAMHREVVEHFDDAPAHGFAGGHGYCESVEAGHGRVETRRVWTSGDVGWFEDRGAWPGLRSFVLVESVREQGDKRAVSRRYYISSLHGDGAEQLAAAVRAHWGIDNGLHWSLDVSFHEDQCRVRARHAAENFALVRKIAQNLIKAEKTAGVGVNAKRLMAGWDDNYLLKILFG